MKKIMICISIAIFIVCNLYEGAYGETKGNEGIDYNDWIEYDDVQRVLNENNLYNSIDFEKEVNNVIEEGYVDLGSYFKGIKEIFVNTFEEKKEMILKLIAITIATAIFTNISNVMDNTYVSQTGFIMVYVILITMILKSFEGVYSIACETMNVLKTFMEVIVPVYSVASFLGNGIKTATVFNQLTMIGITIIEIVFLKIILPLINIHMIINVINNINTMNALERLGNFIKVIVKSGCKMMLIIIASLGTIQRIIAPNMDITTKKLLVNGLKITPFVGKNIEIVNDTVSGAMLMVKNAIGGVSIVVVIIMCIIPLIHILVYVLIYEVTTIIIEAIADKRVVSAISAASESSKMLVQVVLSSAFLFIITVAMLTV